MKEVIGVLLLVALFWGVVWLAGRWLKGGR